LLLAPWYHYLSSQSPVVSSAALPCAAGILLRDEKISELLRSGITSASQVLVCQQDFTHTCGVLQLFRDILRTLLCSPLSGFSLAFLCTGPSSCRNRGVEFTFQRLHPLVKNLIHRSRVPI
jgi:hypothetical protein